MVHSWLMDTGEPVDERRPGRHRRDIVRRRQGILEAAMSQVHASHPALKAEARLVQDNPSAALAAWAGLSSLIVIGRHDRSALASWALGSVGRDLLGNVPTPICVVPG